MGDESLKISQELTLTVPSQSEAHVIDTKQWLLLRGKVQSLATLEKSFGAAAWAFVGIAISGFVALLTWLPAYRVLSSDLQREFTWVWVVLAVITVLGVGVAAALFFAHRTIQTSKSVNVSSVLEDMDALLH